MSRLNIVIAHEDEEYIESLSGFLVAKYSQAFQVSSFSRKEPLEMFLEKNDHKIDLLLASRNLLNDCKHLENIEVTAAFNDGQSSCQIDGFERIGMYQHGDMLVKRIMEILSRENQNCHIEFSKSRSTTVVAVYSPSGGAGKTFVAVNLCIQCAKKGMSVFYLNLESIQSPLPFPGNNSEDNLSHILFHVKERKENLTLKIEGAKCIDTVYGIHYFMPPYSSLEMDEVIPDDLFYLIQQIKQTYTYDIVFIDMTSIFDNKTVALLKESDEILLIVTGDTLSRAKANAFHKELKLISKEQDTHISSKIRVIMNKDMKNQASNDLDYMAWGWPISLRLPYVAELEDQHSEEPYIGTSSQLDRVLYNWTGRYKIYSEDGI